MEYFEPVTVFSNGYNEDGADWSAFEYYIGPDSANAVTVSFAGASAGNCAWSESLTVRSETLNSAGACCAYTNILSNAGVYTYVPSSDYSSCDGNGPCYAGSPGYVTISTADESHEASYLFDI